MKKRMQETLARMERLLASDNLTQEEWEMLLQEHLQAIAFFQHERLIHLIVTMTVALLAMLTLLLCCVAENPACLLLLLLLVVLFVPYILHYMLLENGVQKMYEQYDRLLERTGRHVS